MLLRQKNHPNHSKISHKPIFKPKIRPLLPVRRTWNHHRRNALRTTSNALFRSPLISSPLTIPGHRKHLPLKHSKSRSCESKLEVDKNLYWLCTVVDVCSIRANGHRDKPGQQRSGFKYPFSKALPTILIVLVTSRRSAGQPNERRLDRESLMADGVRKSEVGDRVEWEEGDQAVAKFTNVNACRPVLWAYFLYRTGPGRFIKFTRQNDVLEWDVQSDHTR